MFQHFLSKLRSFGSSQTSTSQRPFTSKRLTHERLEPRMMLTINPSGVEFLVNDVVPGFQAIDANASSVAVSEAAGTIAAYAGLGAGARESIFVRRFDSDGVARSNEAVRVSTTIRGERTGAVVAANEAGNTIVVWQGRGREDKYGIFMQRFNAAGTAQGSEELVNETVGGKQHNPSVAMAADGSFVVTWSGPNGIDPAGIFARRFSSDGAALAGEVLVNTTTVGDQGESAVAVNSGGDYVITWSSRKQTADRDWDVLAQRFNSAGERQGDEFRVNATTAANQQGSSVALQDDGTFMVVWSSFGQDGDSWAVVAQRFDVAGAAAGSEFIVNTLTTGQQRHAQVAGAGNKYLVTWQSGVADGSGWEVMAQEYDAAGVRVGNEQAVNTVLRGSNSGHQQHPAVALDAAGNGAIIWSSYGAADRQGVFGRGFTDDDVSSEPNLTPDLAAISDQEIDPSGELTVTVTATDPNAGDILTYQLDPTNSPAGATIERTDNNTAIIRWTPTAADAENVVSFRVLVTDDGEPPLADAEEFRVAVTNGRLRLDLNGPNEIGADTAAQFAIGLGSALIADSNLSISNAADDMVTRTSVTLREAPDRNQEILEVDTLDTNIMAGYSTGLRRLLLFGVDTAENYERVLKTLRYNNTSATASGTRIVDIQVNDASFLSNKPTITIDLVAAENLVGLAEALENAGAEFFGAAWSEATAEQRELFEDGGQALPFNEVTDSDRTLNLTADTNNITDANVPVWIFLDGTRLEGVQSLATLAQQIGVTIPLSVVPFIAPIENDTLLVGSPLHIPLDGYDPNGGPLTYTVRTSNQAVKAEILSGNQSARVNVAGYGDLVFELFEQRATRATDRFIELANADFFEGIIFHRVIDDFVIQGGDPLGTGRGGSNLGDFDDQFHVDLQHNRSGLLSYAKSTDDTNDSQFFVTEGDSPNLRNLDFNHSIFGILVEGESNRAAISDTSVVRPANEVADGDRRADRPGVPQIGNETPVEFNITMEDVEIFQDDENAVLFLKADPGATGDVTVFVTVTDQQGNTFERRFNVTLEDDTVNGRPFLADIDPVNIAINSTAEIQLAATDVEDDAFVFSAFRSSAGDYTVEVNDSGLVTVTPGTDFEGTLQIEVRVGRAINSSDFDSQLITIEVGTVAGA